MFFHCRSCFNLRHCAERRGPTLTASPISAGSIFVCKPVPSVKSVNTEKKQKGGEKKSCFTGCRLEMKLETEGRKWVEERFFFFLGRSVGFATRDAEFWKPGNGGCWRGHLVTSFSEGAAAARRVVRETLITGGRLSNRDAQTVCPLCGHVAENGA